MVRKGLIFIPVLLVLMLLSACETLQPAGTATTAATQAPTSTPKSTSTATASPEKTAQIKPATLEEIQDIEWRWSLLLETQAETETTISDPQDYTLILREDGVYDFKADCNQGGGTYQVDDSDISLEPGPITRAACGPDSLSTQYLNLLERVESFRIDGKTLVALLENDVGEMQFANGGPAAELPPPCDAGINPASLSVDIIGLPYAYQPNCVPATPYEGDQPTGPSGLPDHIQVIFSTDGADPQADDPILYLISVSAYKGLWDDAGDQDVSLSIAQLQKSLREKPQPAVGADIPILPFEEVSGNSDLQVQKSYLETATGSGVRFITRIVADPAPVASDDPPLFYTYQGFSSDGLYLIALFYPVSTEVLSPSVDIPEEERQRAETDTDTYLRDRTIELNALPESAWNPNLARLDALADSLAYERVFVEQTAPPTRITNTNWQWAELIDTNPSTQPLVPDPQNYTLVLNPDGRLAYKADCNSGGGSYSIRGPQISINLAESTLTDCGATSLSALYLTLLESAQTYSVESNRLVLNLSTEGRMNFYNGGYTISPTTPETGAATLTTLEAINVRSGPGTEYPSYGVVQPGTTMEVSGISEDGDWWVVLITRDISPDGEGWVTGEYVEATGAENVPVVPAPTIKPVIPQEPESDAPNATVLQPVNVRGGPGREYPSYGIAPVGATAAVVGISEDGAWWAIRVPAEISADGLGWVEASAVEVENAGDVPVLPAPPLEE